MNREERIILGLEQAVETLPKVFEEWDTLDEELKDNYKEQLDFLLNSRKTIATNKKYKERLTYLNQKLLEIRDDIEKYMNIKL